MSEQELAGYGTHLRRSRDELVAEVGRLEAELAGYREALEKAMAAIAWYQEVAAAANRYSHYKNGQAIEALIAELINDAGNRGTGAIATIKKTLEK